MHLILLEITLHNCFLLVTGQEKWGKSYFIYTIRVLLKESCITSVYLRLLAILYIGYYSSLKFYLRSKTKSKLKGQLLSNLQLWLKGVKYFINDELFAIGQTMFGWSDRICHQVADKNSFSMLWNINYISWWYFSITTSQ